MRRDGEVHRKKRRSKGERKKQKREEGKNKQWCERKEVAEI